MQDKYNILGLDISDLLKSNPFEIFGKMATNSQEIMKNNIKYHKACVSYHQSITDMLEAINDNAKLLKLDK